MVCIFSQVTAELSPENWSCKLNDKKLQDVSHQSGVKLISFAESFSMVGDWNSINIAYSKLKELVLSDGNFKEEISSNHSFCDENQDDTEEPDEYGEQEKFNGDESNSDKADVISDYVECSISVGDQRTTSVPAPMVICVSDFTDKLIKYEPIEGVTEEVGQSVKNEDTVDKTLTENHNSNVTDTQTRMISLRPRTRSGMRQKRKKCKKPKDIKQSRKTSRNKIKHKKKNLKDKEATEKTKGSFKKRILLKVGKSQDQESEGYTIDIKTEQEEELDISTDDYEWEPETEEKTHVKKCAYEKCIKIVKGNSSNDVKYECVECNYSTNKRGNLREHWQRNHDGKKYSCTECGKTFGIKKDLTRHVKRHFEADHCCSFCGKFYKTKRSWQEHQQIHQAGYEKPEFACDKCDKKFSTKYVLSYHIQSEHMGMKKSFLCMTCGKSFTQKGTYLQHANIHLGIKPYICDVCGVSFRYEKSLKEHKYLHEDIRRFVCSVCDKRFTQSSALAIHLKVHKEYKDYLCQTCGKGFTQRQALTRHERIHNGEKPFSCRLCGRCFNDASIIRRHMILLHKKDPKRWRDDVISKSTPSIESSNTGPNTAEPEVDESYKNPTITESEPEAEILSKSALSFPEMASVKTDSIQDDKNFQTNSTTNVPNSHMTSHYSPCGQNTGETSNLVQPQTDVYRQIVHNMYSDISSIGSRNVNSVNSPISSYNLVDGQSVPDFNRLNPWSGQSANLYPENLMYLHQNYQNYQNQN